MRKEKDILSEMNMMHCNSKVNINYFWLWKVIDNKNELGLLLYVLGFQQSNKRFYATEKQIAKIIGCKWRSVQGVVKRLKKKGYIQTDSKSNHSIGYGGTTRYIVVNLPNLIQDYKSITENEKLDGNIANETIISEASEMKQQTQVSKESKLNVVRKQDFKVVFEDFNTKQLLEHYLPRPNDFLVKAIDHDYLKFRARNEITISNLESLAIFLESKYSDKPEIEIVIMKILEDIERLKPDLVNKNSA